MKIKNPEKCLKASNNEVLKGIGMNQFLRFWGFIWVGLGGGVPKRCNKSKSDSSVWGMMKVTWRYLKLWRRLWENMWNVVVCKEWRRVGKAELVIKTECESCCEEERERGAKFQKNNKRYTNYSVSLCIELFIRSRLGFTLSTFEKIILDTSCGLK